MRWLGRDTSGVRGGVAGLHFAFLVGGVKAVLLGSCFVEKEGGRAGGGFIARDERGETNTKQEDVVPGCRSWVLGEFGRVGLAHRHLELHGDIDGDGDMAEANVPMVI